MSRTADPASPAKMKLLNAAERLILEKGFTATTIDDICDSAELTKGSFFHYFENKEALGKAVLDHSMLKRQETYRNAPYKKIADPLERIYACIEFAIKISRETFEDPNSKGGCLIGNLAQELSYTSPAMRSQCASCFSKVAEEMKEDLKAAKVQYAPKSDIDPHILAEHFVVIMEGALVLAKARQDPRPVAQSLRHFARYLRLLFKQ